MRHPERRTKSVVELLRSEVRTEQKRECLARSGIYTLTRHPERRTKSVVELLRSEVRTEQKREPLAKRDLLQNLAVLPNECYFPMAG